MNCLPTKYIKLKIDHVLKRLVNQQQNFVMSDWEKWEVHKYVNYNIKWIGPEIYNTFSKS